jgi:hypothetical protein
MKLFDFASYRGTFAHTPARLDLAFVDFGNVLARATTHINIAQSEVFQRSDSETRGLALCSATFFDVYVCWCSAEMDEELEETCQISTVSLPEDEENGAVKHRLRSRICNEESPVGHSYRSTSRDVTSSFLWKEDRTSRVDTETSVCLRSALRLWLIRL